jgi:xylose isomerase
MEARYAGWKSPWGSDMLNGKLSLEAIAIDAEERDLDPKHRSGRQEFLENLVNRISDDATMG